MGLSVGGIVDLGVGLGRYSFDYDGVDTDLTATGVIPFVNVFLVKQSESVPVSFSIGGAYETDNFSSDTLAKAGLEVSGSGTSFGATVYSSIPTGSGN